MNIVQTGVKSGGVVISIFTGERSYRACMWEITVLAMNADV